LVHFLPENIGIKWKNQKYKEYDVLSCSVTKIVLKKVDLPSEWKEIMKGRNVSPWVHLGYHVYKEGQRGKFHRFGNEIDQIWFEIPQGECTKWVQLDHLGFDHKMVFNEHKFANTFSLDDGNLEEKDGHDDPVKTTKNWDKIQNQIQITGVEKGENHKKPLINVFQIDLPEIWEKIVSLHYDDWIYVGNVPKKGSRVKNQTFVNKTDHVWFSIRQGEITRRIPVALLKFSDKEFGSSELVEFII
jgi:hypothetical protein